MSKTPPKNQHYYPQMFLQGFCNEKDNIYFLDSVKNKIESRNRKSVAYQKHLYTVSGKQRAQDNYSVEERFSEIESQASPLFTQIREHGFKRISEEEINQLIEFIVLTFVRTPHTVKVSENVITKESVLSEIRSNYSAYPERIEKFLQRLTNKKGLTYAMTLAGSFELRHKRITHNFDGFLLTSENDAPPLLLNDRYTCFEVLDPSIPFIGRDVDWTRLNTKMHFPVSSRCCVTFVPKTEEERKGTSKVRFNKAVLTAQDAGVINILSYRQMEKYAFCRDHAVLEGLKNAE